MDISQNTDILDKGERQKADNISGLLGERSFTVKAVADEQEYYLLNQFCTMIHNLDLRICIEGVENEQEWAMIRKLYPEFTQGYFWGKPCEYEEFMRKFTESRL